MVFMGTATDQSQKHIPGWKRVANVWLEFKQGNMLPWKYFIESALGQLPTFPSQKGRNSAQWQDDMGGRQCVVELICSELFTVNDSS